MISRRMLLRAGAALPLGGFAAARAQVVDLNDAINKAGRQRMLSQRLGKAYIALLQQVEPRLAQQVLDRSMALFDRQLVELKGFASTPALRETYQSLDAAWGAYKLALIGAAPSREGAAAVVAQAGKVLALAHQGTQQYEALSARPVGRLVNVAGRQRMLSQRMAKFYLASQVPLDTAAARAEIGKAREEFIAGLKVLHDAPESTTRIRQELQLADAQWVLYDAALRKSAAGTKPQSDVFIASENVLQVMDTVTGLYSRVQA